MHKGFLGVSALAGVVGLSLAAVAMLAVAPSMLGPLGVTLWFVLLLGGLAGIFIAASYMLGGKLQPKSGIKQQKQAAMRRGLLLGGYATIVLGLSSLQQLNLRDALLLLLLLLLAEFYVVARA
jgi:hypothetical protein